MSTYANATTCAGVALVVLYAFQYWCDDSTAGELIDPLDDVDV